MCFWGKCKVYSKVVRSVAYCLVGMFAGLAFVGCGPKVNMKEREKLPIPLEITLGALEDVNPTVSGRASPIVVRVFELSNESRFQSADYFELMGPGKVSLEGDVVSSEEYTLLPKEVRVVHKRAAFESKFLGVVAGYRDLGSSTWRAAVQLPEPYLAGRLWSKSVSPTKQLFIVLGKSGVVIQEGDSPRK